MSQFDDSKAKLQARRFFFAGAASTLRPDEVFLAGKALADFEQQWRFMHCTKCGSEITNADIGNVTLNTDSDSVIADHISCQGQHSDIAVKASSIV
jgi:hypothetical protein